MAPFYANLTLLLEMAMGVGLLIGARLRHFRAHAWCQSVIIILNLAMIVFTMMPSFRVHVSPKLPLKLGKAYYALASAHAALGTITEIAGLYILLGRGHQPLARKTPHHQLQTVDALGSNSLVGRASVGIRNLRPLVRSAFLPNMNSWNLRQRMPFYVSERPE